MFAKITKGRVHYNTFNEQHCGGKTKVSYYILLREKKYHITSRSSKLS